MTTAADLIDEVIESHHFDKDGELLVNELIQLHGRQSQKGREDFLGIYRDWLKSDDPIKADWAIAIIRRLGVASELPLLEDTLKEIRNGHSNLPKYFEQFLVPAIAELKRRMQP